MLPVNKIALGTTKLGMPYGAVEQVQVSQAVTTGIFQKCQQLGFDMYDTAPSYGVAEALIGENLQGEYAPDLARVQHAPLKIITKIAKVQSVEISMDSINTVQSVFERSLALMQCNSCYGLLIHDVKDLFKVNAEKLVDWMHEMKASGKVEKIGVSVYTPEEVERLLEVFDFDLVQLPCNIFDQRFIQSGVLATLAQKNIEIHARSLFLKGIILKPNAQAKLPSKLLAHNVEFHKFMNQQELSAYDACLHFANAQSLVDRWVIGVSSDKQLKQLCQGVNLLSENMMGIDYRQWAFADAAALDPREW
ncbi:MAG: aldo/keto reductase [Arenicella sp.]